MPETQYITVPLYARVLTTTSSGRQIWTTKKVGEKKVDWTKPGWEREAGLVKRELTGPMYGPSEQYSTLPQGETRYKPPPPPSEKVTTTYKVLPSGEREFLEQQRILEQQERARVGAIGSIGLGEEIYDPETGMYIRKASTRYGPPKEGSYTIITPTKRETTTTTMPPDLTPEERLRIATRIGFESFAYGAATRQAAMLGGAKAVGILGAAGTAITGGLLGLAGVTVMTEAGIDEQLRQIGRDLAQREELAGLRESAFSFGIDKEFKKFEGLFEKFPKELAYTAKKYPEQIAVPFAAFSFGYKLSGKFTTEYSRSVLSAAKLKANEKLLETIRTRQIKNEIKQMGRSKYLPSKQEISINKALAKAEASLSRSVSKMYQKAKFDPREKAQLRAITRTGQKTRTPTILERESTISEQMRKDLAFEDNLVRGIDLYLSRHVMKTDIGIKVQAQLASLTAKVTGQKMALSDRRISRRLDPLNLRVPDPILPRIRDLDAVSTGVATIQGQRGRQRTITSLSLSALEREKEPTIPDIPRIDAPPEKDLGIKLPRIFIPEFEPKKRKARKGAKRKPITPKYRASLSGLDLPRIREPKIVLTGLEKRPRLRKR